MKKVLFVLLITFCLGKEFCVAAPIGKLRFFTDPSCGTCHQVEKEVQDFSRKHRLSFEKVSLFEKDAIDRIKKLEEEYRVSVREVPVLEVEGVAVFQGDDIPRQLQALWENEQEMNLGKKEKTPSAFQMRAGTVAAAGLIDGLNPCAFAAIIFLVLYLLAAQRKDRIPAAAGGFCLGVFTAYFVMGLGFRSLLVLIPFRDSARNVFHLLLALMLFGLALWSFYDAFLSFKHKKITLRLPDKWKQSINSLIIRNSKSRYLFPASFLAGLIVSCIELVCTGQIYLPVIAALVRDGKASGFAYLFLYNIFFILPLIIVGILAYLGLKEDLFRRFFSRSMVPIKVALGVLFIILGLILLN